MKTLTLILLLLPMAASLAGMTLVIEDIPEPYEFESITINKRGVTHLKGLQSPIFSDGFESGGIGQWNRVKSDER